MFQDQICGYFYGVAKNKKTVNIPLKYEGVGTDVFTTTSENGEAGTDYYTDICCTYDYISVFF